MLVFENYGPNNPRFEMEQEFASCARPVGAETLAIPRGETKERRYYEKLAENDCFFEAKELRWLITVSRPEDNFEWQCRMRLINRIDPEINWWRIKVEIAPVTPGTPNLCTDGTLFKSVICTDPESGTQSNCLNQNSNDFGKIRITLGGPPLAPAPAPASWSINPLTTSASQ